MIISIDTGGTKTIFSVFDINGNPIFQEKFPTNHTFSAYKQSIKDKYLDFKAKHSEYKPEVIVFCLPGIVEKTVFVAGNNVNWKNIDFKQNFKDVFETESILAENDANAAAINESIAYPDELVMYMTISTGIGGGFALNGKIPEYLKKAEIGLIRLKKDGKFQAWEDFASGRAIFEKYGLLNEKTNAATWKQISENIAQGLLAFLPVVQPSRIVIGGSIGNFFEKIDLNDLTATLNQYAPDNFNFFDVAISKSNNPDLTVTYGGYRIGKAAINNQSSK